MSVHPLLISLVIITLTFTYIVIYLWRLKRYENYSPSQEDIDHEVKLIELERKSFGRPTLYAFRQSKEYKDWFKRQNIGE